MAHGRLTVVALAASMLLTVDLGHDQTQGGASSDLAVELQRRYEAQQAEIARYLAAHPEVQREVTYTLADGQKGGNDWTQNGVIDDPVAPGAASGVADVNSVPSLSEWGQILLGIPLIAGSMLTGRRRPH